ncbi:alpha/beta hydrolase [Pseudomonas sp. G2-4]|uniref:alpha/beta fold hydrolase n=1 Tax=Pseudomonas sp. G2-4 TaxID=1506334 RepID=UPI0024BAE951|nr:alpha/beta hydrolase [Pseudomonas sp. G2-4]WHS59815.1 alpha/beta hydrolase [Pseudomonas sp. G2-4]
MTVALINGRPISFTDTLDGDVAIVLSHGLFMDQSMFDAQVCVLRKHYRIITWDQRGHGQDASVTEPFSLWDSADDLSALLVHLNIDKAVLLGISQGGYVSLRAALRYPEKVQALVLIATHAGVEEENQKVVYSQLLSAWLENSLTDEIAQSVSVLILGTDKKLAEPWIKKWQTIDNSTLCLNFNALADRDDLAPALSKLQMPALVIWGNEDGAISIEQVRQLEAGITYCQFMEIDGAAHSVNMTHAEIVNTKIKKFLAEALS